eukprot:6183108-Prymnesium_polylepis.1
MRGLPSSSPPLSRRPRVLLRAQRRKVERHYAALAQRAAAAGHAIDLVCCSLEQTGLWEMQACVRRSGGHVLQTETFGAPHLRAS